MSMGEYDDAELCVTAVTAVAKADGMFMIDGLELNVNDMADRSSGTSIGV